MRKKTNSSVIDKYREEWNTMTRYKRRGCLEKATEWWNEYVSDAARGAQSNREVLTYLNYFDEQSGMNSLHKEVLKYQKMRAVSVDIGVSKRSLSYVRELRPSLFYQLDHNNRTPLAFLFSTTFCA